MYAPRVFVSIIGVLLAFAVAAYWMTGSFSTALLQTALCAVILQAGYFIGVLYRVRQEKLRRRNEGLDAPDERRGAEGRARSDRRADAAANLKITDL